MLGMLTRKDALFVTRITSIDRFYRNHMNKYHNDGNREPVGKRCKNKPLIKITPIMPEIDAEDHSNRRCTICERVYNSKGAFRRHMLTVYKDRKRETAGDGEEQELILTLYQYGMILICVVGHVKGHIIASQAIGGI